MKKLILLCLLTPLANAAEVRPEINGTLESECREGSTPSCIINARGAIPSSYYSGLVYVNDQDYVTVQDLSAKDSAASGFYSGAIKTMDMAKKAIGITFDNNVTVDSAHTGLQISGDHHNAIIRNNNLSRMTWCENWEKAKYPKPPGNPQAPCYGGGQPGCLSVSNAGIPGYHLIENNTVSQGSCEGISTIGTSYLWVRGNIVGNTGTDLYLDHVTKTITENNIFYGNPNNENQWYTTKQSGITIGMENYFRNNARAGAEHQLIRNNLIIGGPDCVKFGSIGVDTPSVGLNASAYIYGNTCIGQTDDNHQALSSTPINICAGCGGASAVNEATVINNLIYAPNADSQCFAHNSATNVTMDYNMWTSNPTDSDCDGANDQYGDPGMSQTLSYYQDMDWTTAPSNFANFKLPAGASNAKNTGNLPTPPTWVTDLLNNEGWGILTSEGGGPSACDGTLNTGLTKDADCVNRDASPNIGALETTL